MAEKYKHSRKGKAKKGDSVHEAAAGYAGNVSERGKGRMSSQGQVTIPKPMREHLGVEPGDTVYFYPEEDGVKIKVKKKGIDHLIGILSEYAGDRPVSDEEITEAAARGAYERYMRSLADYRDDRD